MQWGSIDPGIVTLSVNCAGYCPAATSVFVPIIAPNTPINGPALVCQYSCNTYSISCDIPLDSIRWHFPAGVTVTTDSINVHEVNVCFYGSNISGNITVNYNFKIPGSIPATDCGGTSVLSVAEKPQMNIIGSSTLCQDQTFNFSISPVLAGNILWSITNEAGNTTYTSATQSTSLPFTGVWTYGAGTFIVNATDLSGNYCNSPLQLTLTVNPIPPKLDSISGPNPVCPNQAYTYTSFPASSLYTTEWQVTNGSPATGTGNSISITWGATGPYIIKAEQVNTATGCRYPEL